MIQPVNTSRINSIETLHTEMRRLKQRIKNREEMLAKRWNQLPGEAVKATAGAILPVFLGNELASGVAKLVKGAFELVKGKKTDDAPASGWKEMIAGGAKQLGFFGALKLVFSLLKGK